MAKLHENKLVGKAELMRNLGCSRNSFLFHNFAACLAFYQAESLRSGAANFDVGAFEGPIEGVPSFRVWLSNMANFAQAHGRTLEAELKWVTNDARGAAFRHYPTEVFEHIKTYAKSTQQWDQVTSQPWYKFARVIRNSLNHNWLIKSEDLREGVVAEFEDIRITTEHHGCTLADVGLTNHHFRRLADVMIRFAEGDLV